MRYVYFDRLPGFEPGIPCERLTMMAREGTLVEREGGGPGSTTEDGLRYRVTDFRKLARRWPQAVLDYAKLAPIMSAALGRTLVPVFQPFGCNLNWLEPGGAYERHYDRVAWTLLLFLNTLDVGEGGALCVDIGDEVVRFQPRAGSAVLFDGSAFEHWVEKTEAARASAPMVFSSVADAAQYEAETLDSYLYGDDDGER